MSRSFVAGLALILCVVAFASASTNQGGAAKGKYLALFGWTNDTLTLAEVNPVTGKVTGLDWALPTGTPSYYAATTVDVKSSVYYVSLATTTGGVLVGFNAITGKELVSVVTKLPYFALGFDEKTGLIYGACESSEGLSPQPQVNSINPQSGAETAIGKFPANYIPLDNGGSYDAVHRVMYILVAEKGKIRGSTIMGLSVDTGKVVANSALPFPPIVFTAFSNGGSSLYGIAQNITGDTGYYLNALNPTNGQSAPVAPALKSLLPGVYYPTVSGISPLSNEMIVEFTNTSNGATTLAFIDLVKGSITASFNNWPDSAVDIAFVPLP